MRSSTPAGVGGNTPERRNGFVSWQKRFWVAAVLLAMSSQMPVSAAELTKPRQATGIARRVPWISSRVVGTPEPAPPYRTERMFPNLQFTEPIVLTTIPGSNRLAVAELKGKIYTFPNDPNVQKADLLIDLGRTIYGLAFHPGYAVNGQFFVTTVKDAAAIEPDGTRVTRFQVADPQSSGPPQSTINSAHEILSWLSGGHNGGCLRFGPDGYLYIVSGDGSGIADQHETGQNPNDLLACLMRIDVDRPDETRSYGIPGDNPFVGRKDARPEVYAYGLRQFWKFSFDPQGRLWGGDVGQDIWEMIHFIKKGGNYGWSVKEGDHPFRPERPRGPSPILPPLFEHHHTEFRSITAGHVYRSPRLPELQGAYLYGDFDTGKIWMFRYDGSRVIERRELADTTFRIIDFGIDQQGEVLIADYIGGIYRLVPNTMVASRSHPFPEKLSETGLFASTRAHIPAAGVIPYSVNAPLYSDGAHKDRFLAIPAEGRIERDAFWYPGGPGAPPGWIFPEGTVAVKTFSLEMVQGDPSSRRRLETRILHCETPASTEEKDPGLHGHNTVWNGYTYIWNDEQTDAFLADKQGDDRTYVIKDPDSPGGERKQTWHFPSRAECTLCHTMPAKYLLGLNTHQLNRDHDYGGVVANQLETFNHIGLFTSPLEKPVDQLPRLPDYTSAGSTTAQKARAYLHANCAHCHMQWGGGNAEFQLLATLDLKETATIMARAQHGAFGLVEPRLLVPGKPEQSLLYHRMTLNGLGRMPHVSVQVPDRTGIQLIRDWIQNLPEQGDKAAMALTPKPM